MLTSCDVHHPPLQNPCSAARPRGRFCGATNGEELETVHHRCTVCLKITSRICCESPPIISAMRPEGTFGGAEWKRIVGAFSRDRWLLAHLQSGPWQLRPARPRLLRRRPRKG